MINSSRACFLGWACDVQTLRHVYQVYSQAPVAGLGTQDGTAIATGLILICSPSTSRGNKGNRGSKGSGRVVGPFCSLEGMTC